MILKINWPFFLYKKKLQLYQELETQLKSFKEKRKRKMGWEIEGKRKESRKKEIIWQFM